MHWKHCGRKQYSLTALTAADQFKSYDQLENRLKMVLGQKSAPARLDEEDSDEDNDRGSYAPDFSSRRSEHSCKDRQQRLQRT